MLRGAFKPVHGAIVDHNHPLSRGLVGFWPMNEGSGQKVNDVSIFRNAGTIGNAVPNAWVDQGVKMDGTDDYIEIVTNTRYNSNIGTVVVWNRTWQANANIAVLQRGLTDAGKSGITMFLSSAGGGSISASLKTSTGSVLDMNGTNAVVIDGKWHQCALTFDDTRLAAVWFDGRMVTSGTPSGAWSFQVDQPIRMGTLNDVFWTKNAGIYRAARWYNRVLSRAEIAWLYAEAYAGLLPRDDEVLAIIIPATEVEVGLASEQDIALGVSAVKTFSVGLATETDSALAVTARKSITVGLATEQDVALAATSLKTEQWPIDDLQPRHLRLEKCYSPIGGGVALTGREPVIASGNGYWRIELGGFYVKNRTEILIWRALQARFGGRARSIAIPFFDGKRAPWLTVGGAITATANAAVAKGATSIAINVTSAGALLVGQHFSAGHWGYEITAISGPVGSVYTCTIWPKTREAIVSGAPLEFRRPVVRCRLENDNGMDLPLHLLNRGEATVAFVEDVPPDV